MAREKNEKQAPEECAEVTLSRRDALRLGGVIAALGASLGVIEPAEGQGDAASVQLKFYKPTRLSLRPSSEQSELAAVSLKLERQALLAFKGGAVQLKLYVSRDLAKRLELDGVVSGDSVLLAEGILQHKGMLQDKVKPLTRPE